MTSSTPRFDIWYPNVFDEPWAQIICVGSLNFIAVEWLYSSSRRSLGGISVSQCRLKIHRRIIFVESTFLPAEIQSSFLPVTQWRVTTPFDSHTKTSLPPSTPGATIAALFAIPTANQPPLCLSVTVKSKNSEHHLLLCQKGT